MPKPFYTMEEVCRRLNTTSDEVRRLVREGKLREFRDAGKVFYKAEDVDQLAGPDLESEPMLEVVEEPGAQAPAAPSAPSSGGTSIIGLAPFDDEQQGEEKKEGTVISASGIGVFDDDELEIDADPMAKTQVTTPAIDEQMTLESAASGSGLLDLTRESDDTSLGAELLDEIYPGEEAPPTPAPVKEAPAAKAAAPIAAPAPEAVAEALVAGEPMVGTAAPADPYEGLFAGFLVAATILLGVAASVVGGVLQGYLPDYAKLLSDYFFVFLAGTGIVLVLSAVIGLLIGRASQPRRP